MQVCESTSSFHKINYAITNAPLYCVICYFLQIGHTPIHLASSGGHVEVVEKLISSGANVNVVDEVSVTCNY